MAFRVIHGPTNLGYVPSPDQPGRVTVKIQSGHDSTTALDLLALRSTADDIPRLVALLRAAQAERDQLVAENIELESQLTKAEIAIHSAQLEGRAPIWPPACG